MNRLIKNKSGFTLIEVIIVVAIVVMLIAVIISSGIAGLPGGAKKGSKSFSSEVDKNRSSYSARENDFSKYGF